MEHPGQFWIGTYAFSWSVFGRRQQVGMAETLFLVLSVVYAEFAIKVDEWSTLSSLGRKLETPELFMSNASLYRRARIFLLAAAATALFFTHPMSWVSYLGAAGLAAGLFTAPWIGRNLAFAYIRRIGREMVEELNNLKVSDPTAFAREVAEDGPASRLTEWEKEAHVTNQDLSERLKKLRYMGT